MSSLISQSWTIENFHGILFDKILKPILIHPARNTGKEILLGSFITQNCPVIMVIFYL